MTLKEIYQALGEGKKITSRKWSNTSFVYLDTEQNKLLDERLLEIQHPGFYDSHNFSIYEEPEDLDKQIVRTEVIAADFLRYQPGFAVAHISQLIDLKIKQAKL